MYSSVPRFESVVVPKAMCQGKKNTISRARIQVRHWHTGIFTFFSGELQENCSGASIDVHAFPINGVDPNPPHYVVAQFWMGHVVDIEPCRLGL